MPRFLSVVLAAIAILMVTAPTYSTSFVAAKPHDPKRACDAIKLVVANVNRGRLTNPDEGLGPTFYSDQFGEVEREEREDFIKSMQFSEGKQDKVPMGVYRLYRLSKDKYRPQYVVSLIRYRWRNMRLEEDDMFDVQEIDDPRWVSEQTDWLVTFWSNRIKEFREVPELYHLTSEKNRVEPCDTNFYSSVRASNSR